MGESGKFRVPNTGFVRRWESITADKQTATKILNGGSFIVGKGAKITTQPIYSKVSGELPMGEVPETESAAGKRFSMVRFEIEILTKGNVSLAFNSTVGITAWVGGKPVKISDSGIVVDLPQGVQVFTLAVDRGVFKQDALSLQLQDAESGSAQTRLVMGK